MTEELNKAAEAQCDACKKAGLNRTHTCHVYLKGARARGQAKGEVGG